MTSSFNQFMLFYRTRFHLLLALLGSLYAPLSLADHTIDAEAKSACLQISQRLASVSKDDCNTQLELTGQLSVKGVPIIKKLYSERNQQKAKAKVLLLGGIHGDELTSISIVFHWMRLLNREHDGYFQWNIIPLLNPDGLFNKPKSSRENANGVDLNRNFPAPDWNSNALEGYWVKQTKRDPRRYPGPRALSEPESMWLALEIERFQPDVVVAVHAPYGVIDFDGPPHGPSQLGALQLNLLGTFPGSLGNYAGLQKNIPVVTIELEYAGIMPKAEESQKIWRDLVSWIDKNIPKDTPPVYQGLDKFIEMMGKDFNQSNGQFKIIPSLTADQAP